MSFSFHHVQNYNNSSDSTIYTDESRVYEALNHNSHVHKMANHKKGFMHILLTGECVNTNLAEGNYLDKHHIEMSMWKPGVIKLTWFIHIKMQCQH